MNKKIPPLIFPDENTEEYQQKSREIFMRRQQKFLDDPNCITYWLPKIEPHVPTPKTEIVPLYLDYERDHELYSVLDGKAPPKWFYSWIEDLKRAALRVSETGPWFLRTGTFSAKHEWDKTCCVTHLDNLADHVLHIFMMSQVVDLLGLAYNVWAVREWLHGPIQSIYGPWNNMPVRREFRGFGEDGNVLCVHPYWPPNVFEGRGEPIPDLTEMNRLGGDVDAIHSLIQRVSQQVPGEWSIDCLWTYSGWYVTDMARAETSYHWEGCERV